MKPQFDVRNWPYLETRQPRDKIYYYVRLHKFDDVYRVEGDPGSPEFLENYNRAFNQALKDQNFAKMKRHGNQRVGWLIDEYFKSAEFDALKRWTKRNKRWSLKFVREEFGSVKYGKLEKQAFTQYMEKMRDLPGKANQILTDTRTVFSWAENQGLIKLNVLDQVKKIPYKKHPHKAWSVEELERFANAHDHATQERLAFELLSNLGARTGDIIRLGPRNLQDGILYYESEKTGVPVAIRISADLKQAIEAQPVTYETFLFQPYKKRPYPDYSHFHEWFKRRLAKLGIRKTAHGIRKSAAIRQLEAGASIPDAMATQGWKSAETLISYAKEMDREKMSLNASKFLVRSYKIEEEPDVQEDT